MLVSNPLELLITKLVAGVMDAVGAERVPAVPPGVFAETKILDDAVTAVVLTVIVPPDIAADVPTDALEPVAITSLFPAVLSARFPLVAINPVAAVTVPGNDGEDGIDSVTVDPDAAVVISFAVPAIFTLPADGVAVPVSPVNDRKDEAPDSNRVQVGVVTPADVETEVRT